MTHRRHSCNSSTPERFFAIVYEEIEACLFALVWGRKFTMRQIKVGNTSETVVERADYPPERIKEILSKETIAVLGYGVQGRGQSLNMKDNGVHVIIGLRDQGRGWDLAQQDGWVPGKSLFSLEEATQRGTVVQYLLSDAGQKEQWPTIKP